MNLRDPFPNIRPLDLAIEEDGTEALVRSMDEFLARFKWARRTGNTWIAESVPGVLGVFLVELEPSSEDVDRYIWVVVGDVPPAYISSALAQSPRQALQGYIEEMSAWVAAVQRGESVEGLIPVNAPATRRNAEALQSRLYFLSSRMAKREGPGALLEPDSGES
jgi:hypothetical protein